MTIPSEGKQNLSPLMQIAFQALGGTKHWEGTVNGLVGLVRRRFTIESTGTYADETLTFRETMTFDDGETSKREWDVTESADGLHLKADTIDLIRPGRIENGALVFDYRMKLGRIFLPYHDTFYPKPDGRVDNVGRAMFAGIPVLKIKAEASTIR